MTKLLRRVPKGSLVLTVVARIRGLIDEGTLRRGDRLPTELELVEQLGVSRTVVREAVRQLECLGVLTVKRAKGTFVADWNHMSQCAKLVRSALTIAPKELLYFNEFREGIESVAVRRVAETATPECIAELQRLLDEVDGAGDSDVDAWQADFRFHRSLVAAAGNPLTTSILEMIHEFIFASMVQTTPEPRDQHDRDKTRQRHQMILDAIRHHDPDAAEKAMHAHMAYTASRLCDAQRQRKSEPISPQPLLGNHPE
jgi:GntR family transcriptional repressor for pyruvate dehydrogenase complex